MAYDSLLFPPETPLFPHASVVLEYLRTYASVNNLWPHIQLCSRVIDASWIDHHWKVTVSTHSIYRTVSADRIVIANGHYRIPHFPHLPGLKGWQSNGSLSHAAWYRNPSLVGKVIAVVGGGPSGRDISRDYLKVASKVVWAVRKQKSEDRGCLILRGAVTRFLGNKILEFEDGSQYGPVDHVILATGYDLSFPFMKTIVPGLPSISPFSTHVVNSRSSLFPLARFLFPLQDDFPPSAAAFLGLPVKVVPFPLMEAQSRVVLEVFRYPSQLDVRSERDAIKDRFNSMTDAGFSPENIAHDWHILLGVEQFDYRDELHGFIGEHDKTVDEWVKEMYKAKDELRTIWRDLEKVGATDEWISGVGYRGIEDWICMMYKLLERQREK